MKFFDTKLMGDLLQRIEDHQLDVEGLHIRKIRSCYSDARSFYL